MKRLVRSAKRIARERGAQILQVRAQKHWTVGDYIEEGKYRGFLVLEVWADGKAVLFR